MPISRDFWNGKRVLLTGSTGFKGSWLSIWLSRLGARVSGIGLAPGRNDLFLTAGIDGLIDNVILDIRDRAALAAFVEASNPQIVLHLAAQALVRESYREPVETFETNVVGTVNLLEACRSLNELSVVIAVTTDKVYANVESHLPYRECDPLGGHDPYSASKAACEIAVESYRKSFLAERDVAVAAARAGNVIGGGDWSSDRLLPDAVRAWSNDQPLEIRQPNSVRPWQHVLEPLSGYLLLAERLTSQPELSGGYNFGPHTHEAATVRRVIDLARGGFGSGEVTYSADPGPHEAGLLILETAKSRAILGQSPRWSLETGVQRTMEWYRRYLDGEAALDLCLEDLARWEASA